MEQKEQRISIGISGLTGKLRDIITILELLQAALPILDRADSLRNDAADLINGLFVDAQVVLNELRAKCYYTDK